ncbi:hypothetical protein SPI_06662 [Niveomyces insectorum RCEF 264]|uniref:Uncharacterized protein n=1 Tax=Niveomyces insectorum RCEF 264 TaxID=1081102 RepID=A0A167RH45_9HYPO|nr:hypothetical protein SPI_06662 [Niveomyces insectorum RCEF 264]
MAALASDDKNLSHLQHLIEYDPLEDNVTRTFLQDACSFRNGGMLCRVTRYDDDQLAPSGPFQDRFVHRKFPSPWPDGASPVYKTVWDHGVASAAHGNKRWAQDRGRDWDRDKDGCVLRMMVSRAFGDSCWKWAIASAGGDAAALLRPGSPPDTRVRCPHAALLTAEAGRDCYARPEQAVVPDPDDLRVAGQAVQKKRLWIRWAPWKSSRKGEKTTTDQHHHHCQ